MANKIVVAPSLLSADFGALNQEIQAVLAAGASWLHYDVMDNHYVPNLSFGSGVLSGLKKHYPQVFWDVHLMTMPVDSLVPAMAKAGADLISFHPEASLHVSRTISLIKDCGCKVGLAINPATTLDCLQYTLADLDLVLVMSINPGFSGQKFIDSSYDKIKLVAKLLTDYESRHGRRPRLEVDGGVNSKNSAHLLELGVDTLVAGTSIFGQKDYKQAIHDLKNSA